MKKPGQKLFKSEMSEYFTAQDLYVGARLDLNSQPFQLLDADDFTFNYMEQHPDEVTHAIKSFFCLFSFPQPIFINLNYSLMNKSSNSLLSCAKIYVSTQKPHQKPYVSQLLSSLRPILAPLSAK